MKTTIWVGELNGSYLVYDPLIQIPECPHVFLWDPSSGEMREFVASSVREHIVTQENLPVSAAHIEQYKKWYATEGETWSKEERLYYETRQREEEEKKRKCLEIEMAKAAALAEAQRLEREAERIAKLTPEERHKERLERLGKEYLGVRQAKPNPSRRRVTHCWACKKTLDNSIDVECVSCNWILCQCGACGCRI